MSKRVRTSQPSTPVAPSTEQDPAFDIVNAIENLDFAATPKLALLIRWSEAEAMANRGGTNIEIEQLAWRGIKLLCQDVVQELHDLQRLAGVRENDKGGER